MKPIESELWNHAVSQHPTAGPSWRGITSFGQTFWLMSSQMAMLVHVLPPVGCYTVVLSCVVLVFGRLALQSFQFPALSFGPGCDYPSHKTCGLSVSVGLAEYCLNRNSCAALYPDVANRVWECVFEVDEGLCVGCWTGWAMWLSCHGPPTGMKLIIIFLSWSIVEMQSVFFQLYLPEN